MGVIRSPETSVNFYQTTWGPVPEDSTLCSHIGVIPDYISIFGTYFSTTAMYLVFIKFTYSSGVQHRIVL
jgi:hypothetical protein